MGHIADTFLSLPREERLEVLMSVTGSRAGADLDWDDLDVQFYQINTNPGAANHSAGESHRGHATLEVAGGGLARGELAELVGLRSGGIFLNGAADDPAHEMHGRWQLGVDPEPRFSTGNFTLPEDTDVPDDWQVENTAGSTEQWNGEYAVSVQPDVWYISAPHQFGPNAVDGIGATMHMDHFFINMREWGGKGPVYDRHNTIHEHWTQESGGASGFSFYRSVQLYWNIFEE